ncbi:MAG: dihydrodipicolinate synthase family protein, partial [Bdellovibrionales bacterium]|nr:dihydrodipicolinate synthase family protein [Bdellovibrionales bacterium]
MGNWQYLSFDEFRTGISRLKEEGIPLIVGVGALNTSEAEQRVRTAVDLRADALMLLPAITGLTAGEFQEHHFATLLLAAGNTPCIVYNNPNAYGFSMPTSMFHRLRATHPHLVAFKESGGKDALTAAAQDFSQDRDCELGVGLDTMVYHGVVNCGASFCIAGVANFLPRECLRLWELCEAGRTDADSRRLARELDEALMPLFELDADPRLVLWYKAAMTYRGHDGYVDHRPSYARLTEPQVGHLRRLLDDFDAWWKTWEGAE